MRPASPEVMAHSCPTRSGGIAPETATGIPSDNTTVLAACRGQDPDDLPPRLAVRRGQWHLAEHDPDGPSGSAQAGRPAAVVRHTLLVDPRDAVRGPVNRGEKARLPPAES